MSEALSYTEDEIKSFLPSGWNLAGDSAGRWVEKRQAWVTTIVDDVEFDWPVVVPMRAAEEHGRMEALRQAMDDTYRHRLGRPTRGLGI